MSQIEYERIGLVLTYSGQAKTRNRGTAQVNVEFKRVADSDVEIGNDIMAPIIRNAEHDFEGPFVSDKPVVLLLVDGQTDGNIIVYVTRIEFTIESL